MFCSNQNNFNQNTVSAGTNTVPIIAQLDVLESVDEQDYILKSGGTWIHVHTSEDEKYYSDADFDFEYGSYGIEDSTM